MRRLTKALVLIVWNEVEGCRLDVPRLPRGDFDEVFAIDGGSTDGTVDYLKAQGIPVFRQRRRSLNIGLFRPARSTFGSGLSRAVKSAD